MLKKTSEAQSLERIFPVLYKNEKLNDFFEKLANSEDKTFGVFSFPIKPIDPLACLEILGQKDSYHFYWEKPHSDFALSAGQALYSISTKERNRFGNLEKKFSALQSQTLEFSAFNHSYAGMHLLGGSAFFNGTPSKAWQGFKSATLTLPEWLVIKDGQFGIITVAIKSDENDTAHSLSEKLIQRLESISGIFDIDEKDVLNVSTLPNKYVQRNTIEGQDEWVQSVQQAKEFISLGKFEKIVLARKIDVKLDADVVPTFVLNRLRQQYPNCYSFLIAFPGSDTFIGCSPERLVSFHNKFLRTDALAGSIKRGASATEDAVFEKKLLNSTKDVSEHKFVTKAIEQRLKSISGKVEKGNQPSIKKLSNVQHLYTPIRAWFANGTNRFSVMEKLHPTPAVGGYPWEDAAPHIKNLEHFDRGWYAGPIGWINKQGGGEFAVAIRSGLIGNKKARFFAGCGIVQDSDPQLEWEETNLKFLPMLSALNND